MSRTWEYLAIRRVVVSVGDATSPIVCRQGEPQIAARAHGTIANGQADNPSIQAFQCDPDPDYLTFRTDVRPEFVEFEFGTFHRRCQGFTDGPESFFQIGNDCRTTDASHTSNGALGKAFMMQTFDQIQLRGPFLGACIRRGIDAAGVAVVLLATVCSRVVPFFRTRSLPQCLHVKPAISDSIV
jgi:hypothetical protein